MGRTTKLKVFRTPIGFQDAYVAAPSRKAALAAWGSEANLFARGVAEEVHDPALMHEPLAHPGTVIRRSRGSRAEQLAAAPPPQRSSKAPAKAPTKVEQRARSQGKAKPAAKLMPRPSRAELDQVEEAITQADAAYAARRAALVNEEKRLAQERQDLDATHRTNLARLREQRETARRTYERAMQEWRP